VIKININQTTKNSNKKKKLPRAFPDVGRSAKDEKEDPLDSEKTIKHNK
jgi:hypothetical protein